MKTQKSIEERMQVLPMDLLRMVATGELTLAQAEAQAKQRLPLRVEFQTTQYEFAHGKLPRGRGCWAFVIVSSYTGQPHPKVTETLWAPFGTYADAKSFVRRHLSQLGVGGYVAAVVQS